MSPEANIFIFHSRVFANENIYELARGLEDVGCGTAEIQKKITVRKHSERVWEHGNIGQFWKGTREQGPTLGDPQQC